MAHIRAYDNVNVLWLWVTAAWVEVPKRVGNVGQFHSACQ